MEENNEFLQNVSQWANDVLVWIGFGTLAGLLAKAIMPGKDPGGAVATLAMGIGGTVIGCGVLTFFSPQGTRVTPISVAGFAVATAGSFVILFFYKLLGGYYFREGDGPIVRNRPRRKAALRRPAAVVYEDEV
ncbi:hypothetical protein Psta_0714 [Pirellula staleyi DSM 6068]|uniref:Transglycosylase-associated protein n=1 Tax=Pirellula staleyi (strain ATCC 27377 / DSM 6068 / ICPB 4128) TaxID=530564 RepID=D2R5E1_PIRSD|nr:transglycosylase [Pirellula staleyi]ADB15400.1 hypothetical protein Psta_0714 [Pirellula staleyi DSM 6068]